MFIEYIWMVDNTIYSKTKFVVTDKKKITLRNIPFWNFYQDSVEVLLKPVRFYNDPSRMNNNKLVVCECWKTNEEVHETNKRTSVRDFLNTKISMNNIFGFEQQFIILNRDTDNP